MINCNPETVSTDYDTSDRLYFEPLTARGRAGHPGQGAGKRGPEGRYRAVWRPDAAETRPRDRAVGRADPRHLGRFDRSRRGSRSLQAPPRQARPQAAEERDRLFGRAGAADRRGPRSAAGRSAILRPRRTGDGDHSRRERARRLSARRAAEPGALRRQGSLPQRQDRPDQHGSRHEPAPVRPLSVGCDRDRRRRPFRWQDRGRGGYHGTHRGGRNSFRRQRLFPPASLLEPRNDREARAADAKACAGARCRRADERAIRPEGRRRFTCSRSIRAPRALCRSSPR